MNVTIPSTFLNDAKNILNNKSLNNNNNNNNSKVDYFNSVVATNTEYQANNAFSNNWAEIKNNNNSQQTKLK
jgi:hypothetical protein